MRTLSLLLFVCVVLALNTLQCHARRRNLTEITYRFTNCGSSNHDGPRVNAECGRLYEQINSPIITNQRLFQFERQDGQYDGGQGFRLPRNDLYNITIAGARGGEGLCNFEYGLGGVVRMQVELTTDYEYLILVGHRGTSVCDVPDNTDNPICQQPRPRNVTEAEACEVDWKNFVNETLNVEHFNGGGGGGGASMIWPRRKNDSEFTNFPIAIAPGGGGASTVLDYEALQLILSSISLNYPSSGTKEEIYRFHVNTHFIQYGLDWAEGGRGYKPRPPNEFVVLIISGSGGGWNPVVGFPLLEVDGKLLSQPNNFAQGGFDCSSGVPSESRVFTGVYGGYGGGGGGCGSGGAGGGYTGGHIFGNTNTIPGGGGDVGVFNLTELPLVRMLGRNNNDGDGYVEIVSSNCECAGQCVVYPEEKQFECWCPNDALLAGDGSNCYKERSVFVNEQEPITVTSNGETVFLTGLQFNGSLNIFGLDVTLTVNPISDGNSVAMEDVACAVVFVGRNSQSVVASNPVRVDGSGRSYKISILEEIDNGTNGVKPSPDYVTFLPDPILVRGAVLVSNGQCSLSSPLQVNISSESGIPPINDFGNFENDFVINSARFILAAEEAPTTTSTPPEPAQGAVNIGLVLGLVIAGMLLTALVGIVIVVVYIRYSPTKRRTVIISSTRESGSNLIDPTTATETTFSAGYEKVKDGEVEAKIDKDTGNEYSYVTVKGGGASINPYATLTSDGMAYETPVSLTGDGFKPRYGIIAPAIDFTMYNKERSSSTINNWDYPRNNLVYLRELGEGQFGKVLLMKATDIAGYTGKIPVAVKTLTSRDPEVIKKFMEEADLMKKFSHPNIVSLLGISIAESDGEIDEDSAPLMILEYMPYGDLQSFLTTHKPDDETQQTSISQQHFLNFSIDMARALDFLAINKYVHRDVAARNCLVSPDLHIKIADFGLSRGVYDKDYYKIAGKAVLPVRWMAPESLLFGIFSTASDVWSYGVTIWEITSYGETPLEEMEVQEIVTAAQNISLEHSRPQYCSDELYELMCNCHRHDAKDRPSFEDILTLLVKKD
ncbi:uncharacterized protein LOC135347441 isoform X3 [Halichondria panicea]|uniref:uncharacterized protein LOC135347441 isoform X3 n=1 Tax=Halichondria panicea TaxID=6063 RepID=UPI00312B4CA1